MILTENYQQCVVIAALCTLRSVVKFCHNLDNSIYMLFACPYMYANSTILIIINSWHWKYTSFNKLYVSSVHIFVQRPKCGICHCELVLHHKSEAHVCQLHILANGQYVEVVLYFFIHPSTFATYAIYFIKSINIIIKTIIKLLSLHHHQFLLGGLGPQ